ncbi:iron-sulfur cluster co-chaperone HscB C-terminal domain-containing protein [Lewinella sp. IMCC34191]|uniref:iron-sulfur cluster co-chaperone HscB C-terminal domain-containing protein n=1 Tax=Lewinella sp. IMCC34191 TaxID=2259172 RepID=UPI000E2345CF|nr:iron-sulfur cluster co-chaperone HscB C-terminal domain-containing protein [Lewinella sp. IMCC34191]
MPDYFEFFGLHPSPRIDLAALKKAFYANSKQFHPDFHTLEDEATQQDILEKSTLNNEAYKVLSDDDQRLRHLLEIKGILEDEGQNKVPQEFLMEIMEVNEALMELEFEDDPAVRQKVEGLIDQLESSLNREVAPLMAAYNPDEVTEADLQLLKDYYLKRRYLMRLREKI